MKGATWQGPENCWQLLIFNCHPKALGWQSAGKQGFHPTTIMNWILPTVWRAWKMGRWEQKQMKTHGFQLLENLGKEDSPTASWDNTQVLSEATKLVVIRCAATGSTALTLQASEVLLQSFLLQEAFPYPAQRASQATASFPDSLLCWSCCLKNCVWYLTWINCCSSTEYVPKIHVLFVCSPVSFSSSPTEISIGKIVSPLEGSSEFLLYALTAHCRHLVNHYWLMDRSPHPSPPPKGIRGIANHCQIHIMKWLGVIR